jgi:hypothetical protein
VFKCWIKRLQEFVELRARGWRVLAQCSIFHAEVFEPLLERLYLLCWLLSLSVLKRASHQ